MKEEVNLKQLTLLLADRVDISHQEAESFLKKFFAAVPEILSKESLLEIKDLGTFTLTKISEEDDAKAAKEENDNTLYFKLRFSPAETLKNSANKPFLYFEKVLLNEGVSLEGLTVVEEKKEKGTREEILIKIDRNKAFSSNIKAKQKTRKRPIARWMPVLGTAAVVAALIFFFMSAQRKAQAIKNNPEKVTAKTTTTKAPEPNLAILNDSSRTSNPLPKEPEKIQLAPDKTLRLIALEKFGNREFWVYIYYKNKNKIKNPNIVPVGIELIMPDKSEYNIDASNPQSVAKAKALGDMELKKFQ